MYLNYKTFQNKEKVDFRVKHFFIIELPLNEIVIDFYDKLIDGMLERQLLPFSTLYHWDLPEQLAKAGGWRNNDVSKWIGDYSEIIVKIVHHICIFIQIIYF